MLFVTHLVLYFCVSADIFINRCIVNNVECVYAAHPFISVDEVLQYTSLFLESPGTSN